MSEEPTQEPKPTVHGHFEGPATEQDYLEAQEMDVRQTAQLHYKERQGRAEISRLRPDEYDEITGLSYGAHFRGKVNDRLQKLDPNEQRKLVPNNALIVNLDGKDLKKIND